MALTREVKVGNVIVGGANRVTIQSMTNTPTLDTDATIAQIIRIADAGADIVRVTVMSVKEAHNLVNIKEGLRAAGCFVPLVADVHFNPQIAEIAATCVEKVRINPGNYGIPSGKAYSALTDTDYELELAKAYEAFSRLTAICKEHGTALRIGVNHGSLSPRIIYKYGNTPAGMANSAMEFIRFSVQNNFKNVVVSLKSSNAGIMIEANRLMVDLMKKEDVNFPLHLGVTEAGEGEDGRVRSVAGIGTLLLEGIGNTIRVSLTEEPEEEIPVAKYLIKKVESQRGSKLTYCLPVSEIDNQYYSEPVGNIGGTNVPVVIGTIGDMPGIGKMNEPKADIYLSKDSLPVLGSDFFNSELFDNCDLRFVVVTLEDINNEIAKRLKDNSKIVIIAESVSENIPAEMTLLLTKLKSHKVTNPVIFRKVYSEIDTGEFMISAAADFSPLLLQGAGNGLWIEHTNPEYGSQAVSLAFSILQSCRVRISKTEFISCPSCGRTMFDIQEATKTVKQRTSHLKGLKIAIMGCIVNGPGEMADADYGYVGAGRNTITLYRKQLPVKRNIPADKAPDELIELIKQHNDWVEPGV